jgi:hypothetical protein
MTTTSVGTSDEEEAGELMAVDIGNKEQRKGKRPVSPTTAQRVKTDTPP